MRTVTYALALALVAGAPSVRAQAPPSYDLVVIGGTPGGIACAVRAAREGRKVLLVNRTNHLGGLMSGGIGIADTQYEGRRAPLLDEFTRRVLEHYINKYGRDSEQVRVARPGPRNRANVPVGSQNWIRGAGLRYEKSQQV